MQKQYMTIINRVVFYMVIFSGIVTPVMAQHNTASVQNIKAVFLYNFTKYMKWSGLEQSSTFNIAVIGESPILDPLEQISLKRRVNQKAIQIKHFENADQINDSHILFIPESKKTELNTITDKIRKKNILIVSEIDGSLESGVMINILISQETVKFEINVRAMKKAGFQPGSELLKLAVRLIE